MFLQGLAVFVPQETQHQRALSNPMEAGTGEVAAALSRRGLRGAGAFPASSSRLVCRRGPCPTSSVRCGVRTLSLPGRQGARHCRTPGCLGSPPGASVTTRRPWTGCQSPAATSPRWGRRTAATSEEAFCRVKEIHSLPEATSYL